MKIYGKDFDLVQSFFPYEAVTSLEVIDQEGIPSCKSFVSSLNGYNTPEEDGGGLSLGLENYGMKTFRDLLVYYHINLDVGSFLKALENQLFTYRSVGLDLLKDACTLPYLFLRFGMRRLIGVFYTLGDDMADVLDLIRKYIVGAHPSFQ